MLEEWKTIFGGAYAVSNLGEVKRLKSGQGARPGRNLKKIMTSIGYYQVTLRNSGLSQNVRIHTLVANAFLGEQEKGIEVNHIDGDKSNNHISNLEYVTKQGNAIHARRTGLHGEKYIDLPEKIVSLVNSGVGCRNVLKELGISYETYKKYAPLRTKT